jgi:opacity protein-like surface antigen
MKKFLLLFALAVLPALAAAQMPRSGPRAGTYEFYLSPVFTESKSQSFEGGTTARTDTGYGFGFGFARNFTPHWNAGVEFSWGESYYRTTMQGTGAQAGQSINSSGTIDTTTLRFAGTWNMLATDLTPFVTAGGGWTHIYTDLPAGPPQNSCWYYPWWGPVCTTYIPTQNTTKFSYNLGAGVRWDVGPYLVRGLVNAQRVDIGGAQGKDYWTQFRLDFGMRFR